MTEEELAAQIKTYAELAQKDKRVDVAGLALAALQSHESNMLSPKEKRISYLISLSLPPLGLVWAFKFYFSGKSDGKHAAYVNVALTVISLILLLVLGKTLISGSGTSIQQIQQIQPQDYQQFLQ